MEDTLQDCKGYEAFTPIQLGNIVWAVGASRVSKRAARVYFGCLAVVATRLAAGRYRRANLRTCKVQNRYRIDELETVTGLKRAVVRRGLRELAEAKLLSFSEKEIQVTRENLADENVGAIAIRGRSPNRPIPMPRSVLRFLARERSWALSKVMIAYAVRGLALPRKGGDIKNRGTVKASWISKHFGLSIRSVRYARERLYQLAWISPDSGSFQRKLNRDGAYFAIALDWNFVPAAPRRSAKIAPLAPRNTPVFAPLSKDKKTSNEVKNQQTPLSGSSGVFKREGKANVRTPSIRTIVREDLSRFDRLHELYLQAVKANWLQHSEANALNFIAAAVRAREAEGDASRIFVSLVKRGLWNHITQAQEERARKSLNRFREQNRFWFRPNISFSL